MKIAIVLGTRPEVIKLSPLLDRMGKAFDLHVIHTGQHYDPALDRELFRELKLRYPKIRYRPVKKGFAEQIASQVTSLAQSFQKLRPDFVIVQGDTNSAMTAAMVAARLNIPVVHIEAGCRSGNIHSPEEQNRLMIDAISRINFCSDTQAIDNLKKEGRKAASYLSGSLTFDALRRSSKLAKKVKPRFKLRKESYVLVTLHRAENMLDGKKFLEKISLLNWLSERTQVIFAVHPRTQKYLRDNKIRVSSKVHLTGPLGHLEFINLLENCRLVFSDSGGIQEEAAYFDRPCMVLRTETEWMRLIKAGKNFLLRDLNSKSYKLVETLLTDDKFYKKVRMRKNPESKTGAANEIIQILKTLRK